MSRKLKNLVVKMLSENTGAHLLDSGGAYGRNFEKNKGMTVKDWDKTPEARLEVYHYTIGDKHSVDLYAQTSVYHFMTKTLELDEYCNRFNHLKCDNHDSDVYGVSDNQRAWLDKFHFEIGDSFNNVNWGSPTSQTLQGAEVSRNDTYTGMEHYVLLQVHGGCDVRGGYTDAKLFKLPDYCASAIDWVYAADEAYFSHEIEDKRWCFDLCHDVFTNEEGVSIEEKELLEFVKTLQLEECKTFVIDGDVRGSF